MAVVLVLVLEGHDGWAKPHWSPIRHPSVSTFKPMSPGSSLAGDSTAPSDVIALVWSPRASLLGACLRAGADPGRFLARNRMASRHIRGPAGGEWSSVFRATPAGVDSVGSVQEVLTRGAKDRKLGDTDTTGASGLFEEVMSTGSDVQLVVAPSGD